MVPLPGSTAVIIWPLQSGRVQNLRLTCSHPLVRRRTRSVGQSRPVRRRPGIYTPCPPGAHMCRSPSFQAFRFLRFGIRGQGGVGHAEVRHQRLAARVEDSVGRLKVDRRQLGARRCEEVEEGQRWQEKAPLTCFDLVPPASSLDDGMK